MQQYYNHFYQEARDLEHHYQDVVDQRDNPAAQALRREMLELIEDLEKDKSPRSLEDRIKRIVYEVEEIRAHGDMVMDYADLDYFRHHYELMQRELRKLPNY